MSLTAVHVWQLTDPTAMWLGWVSRVERPTRHNIGHFGRCWRATVSCTLQSTYRSDCMPVTTAQLVTILWTVTRPQKIHQHPCFGPSRRTVQRASCVHQVHYLFVILENVKVCFRLLPRMLFTNQILNQHWWMSSHTMLSHRQLCVQQEIILFFSCLCDLAFTSIWSAWMKTSCKARNEKIERHRRLWMSNIFANDFHLRCAHSPHSVLTVFMLLMI